MSETQPVPLPEVSRDEASLKHTVSLWEIFLTFLVIGATSFGGGVVAYLRNSLVTSKKWLDDEEFLAALEISQALPGLNATNMSVIVGDRLRGPVGAIMGFAGMTLPGTMLVIILGMVYAHESHNSLIIGTLKGVGAASVGLLLAVTFQIGHKQLEHRLDLTIVIVTVAMISYFQISLVLVLLTVGPVAIFLYRPHPSRPLSPDKSGTKPQSLIRRMNYPSLNLLWVFSLLSVLAIGGGTAVLPEMKSLTEQQHWLTSEEFRDVYSLGQLAPGPNMLMVAVIGYRVDGYLGAAVAFGTFFFPSCLITFITARIWDHFRASPWRLAVQRGMAPLVIGLMCAGVVAIARTAIINVTTVGLAIAVFAALYFGKKINPAFLILAGGLFGLAFLR